MVEERQFVCIKVIAFSQEIVVRVEDIVLVRTHTLSLTNIKAFITLKEELSNQELEMTLEEFKRLKDILTDQGE